MFWFSIGYSENTKRSHWLIHGVQGINVDDMGSMWGRCEVDVRSMWGRCRVDVGSI